MAKIILEHSDFTLEIESVKYAHLLAKARGNGLSDEALVSRWSWGAGVETVSFVNERNETEVIWRAGDETFPHEPFFFDNAVQDVWVEFKEGCSDIGRPELRHMDANARFKVRANSLFGPLEFGNDIGRSDFSFAYRRDGVMRRFSVSFDVLSTKLDYHNHWKKIVADVESEYRMLAYDFLKRTYHTIKEDPEGETSDMIWWNVFREERESFLTACRLILNRPKTRHLQYEEWRRADQLRMIGPQLENEIAEHRGDPARLYRVMVDDDSRDTPENRFFKFAVETVSARHALLSERVREAAVKRNASAAFLREIDETAAALDEIRANPFFRGVGRFEGIKQVSLVLQQGVGYADVLRIFGVLTAFYSLHDGLFSLETKDIAELYEIWCFIEVKNRVANLLKVEPKDVKHLNRGELGELFGADMRTGKKSRILIEKGDTRLELFYNPKSVESGESGIEGTETPTGGTQKPDIVLQLVRKYDGQDSFRLTYLFDAKYRLDEKDHGVDTPPEDAINQMHRYRDAIYYRNKDNPREEFKREVVGGYILFPGNGADEQIKDAYFYKSIDQVNIGALPLRPGVKANGQMLQDFIGKLIDKKTDDQIEDSIPPKGTILPAATVRAVMETWVYGTYHGKQQLDWIDKKGLYNLPDDIAAKLGIYTDADAAERRLLALIPPGRKPTEPLIFFRIERSLGKKTQAFLTENGYPTKMKHDHYFMWKVKRYSSKALAAIKLVSGGQTGVDQGALEAAIDLGLDYGGWVPKGWKTETGPLDKRYREKMREHVSGDYKDRTRQNVVDSHATLILVDNLPLSGGTLLTKRYCENGHSHFVISMNESSAVEKVQKWLRAFFTEDYPTPFVLNVAGPRESKLPGIQAKTRAFLAEVVRTM